MKIKIYCVTYKGYNRLTVTLKSLFDSDIEKYDYEVNIINNHSDFNINDTFKEKVNVLHNNLRPDFSEGHLSRNWNQGIINGFKDPINPDCDIVLNIQDDVIFKKDCFTKLKEAHKKFDLIQNGHGDTFISYKIDAIKSVGLWDERFCNISYQVADYLIRCKIHHPEKCSINDFHHKRVLNPFVPGNSHASASYFVDEDARLIDEQWDQGNWNIEYSRNLFKYKWGGKEFSDVGLEQKIESYIFYPYFEKYLDLKGKKYFGV